MNGQLSGKCVFLQCLLSKFLSKNWSCVRATCSVSLTRPVRLTNVLPALCILLFFLPLHCSHFSFTRMQYWHPSLDLHSGPEGQWANPASSFFTSCLSLPVFLTCRCHFLPVSTFPAHLSGPDQQQWTGATGVPATRGVTVVAMPADESPPHNCHGNVIYKLRNLWNQLMLHRTNKTCQWRGKVACSLRMV